MRYLLVDTAYLIFRSHFAFAGMNKNDNTSSAFYGFARNLITLSEQYKPDFVYFLNDTIEPTWRHKEHQGYKAGRPPIAPEMQEQIPIIIDWCQKVAPKGYLATPGWEADDLIYTLAINIVLGQKAPKRTKIIEKNELEIEDLASFFDQPESSLQTETETHPPSELFEVDLQAFNQEITENQDQILILSSDRDLYQLLVLPQVKFLKSDKTGNINLFGDSDFITKYELDPKQWLDYKALVGDNSDNLTGIPGVGSKTATTLLQNITSLYYLLGALGLDNSLFLKSAILDRIKPISFFQTQAQEYVQNPKNTKLIQKIKDNQAQLKETYRLSSLQIVPNVNFQPSKIDFSKSAELFEKHKFNSLLKRLNLSSFDGGQEALF
jgi:DNA polymerase-1